MSVIMTIPPPEIDFWVLMGSSALTIPNVFLLNRHIYKKRWFLRFIPISIASILIGILIKDIFEIEFYKLLIILPIEVYLIKLTQLIYKYFNLDYIVNIRGIDFGEKDRDLYGMPTGDSFVTAGIIILMILLLFII